MQTEVRLQNRHIWISAELAASVFGDAVQVQTVYYPQRQALLLAPYGDEVFASLHKTALQMLKTRNLQGDKSLSVQELLIDHELDDSDRLLEFLVTPGSGMLHVIL